MVNRQRRNRPKEIATLDRSEVDPKTPAPPVLAPEPVWPDDVPDEASDGPLLMRAVADGIAMRDTASATRLAVSLLERREEMQGDPLAGPLALLLRYSQDTLERMPPLGDVERIPIHYDDAFAACFEQIIALLRLQDAQVAELQAIAAELL